MSNEQCCIHTRCIISHFFTVKPQSNVETTETEDVSIVGAKDGTPVSPIPVEVQRMNNNDGGTITSDLASYASSHQQKSGDCLVVSDWVQKGLFKYCKFVTRSDDMEYGQPLSLFAIEENSIMTDKQKWWNEHKRTITQILKEKQGCVVESIQSMFKSKQKL